VSAELSPESTTEAFAHRSVIRSALDDVHRALVDNTDGEVAGYIPELARVDPDRFGIAVATVDGHGYDTGDAGELFTIQSISKAFVYGLALDDHGHKEVLRKVGVEPSGDAFNSIVMDEENNRPLNPMVNAGAIACSALILGDGLEQRRQRVLDMFSGYAGRPLDIDWNVCESERRTGHRNRAIAYLELNSGMIDEPVEEHLDLYFAQCSILVTARDLAMMAATLANGGVNPVTGERVISSGNVSRVLTVMATCGMYDWSGEWMYRVGLPAKSGVGGGIIAVLPGQLGIGTFSPRLDDHGNSCRGVDTCEELGRTFSLHLLDAGAHTAPAVRREYDASTVPSKRMRRAAERELLDARGAEIVVFELQGDLFFAPAEQVVRAVEGVAGRVRAVVLDARRVGRATSSAARLLGELQRQLAAVGVRLVMAGCPDELREGWKWAGFDWPVDDLVADADAALERCEDELLERATGTDADAHDHVDLGEIDILRDLDPDDLAAVAARLESHTYAPDEEILRAGEVADRLCFLASGSANVCIEIGEGRVRRIHSLGPGCAFGEAAVFQGGLRSATVVADGPATVLSLTLESLEELSRTRPAIGVHLLGAIGRRVFEMLGRALGEIAALEA
jgi:glutaminase